MQLPLELRQVLEKQTGSVPAPEIARAAAQLSEAYRKGDFTAAPLKSAAHRLAYLQVRMPATYAACRHVFAKLAEAMPDFAPKSLLDIGAGPGTASWAALVQFSSVSQVTLVERDVELVRIGQSLADEAAHLPLKNAAWVTANLRELAPTPHNLVVLSYALGELSSGEAHRLLLSAANSAEVLIVIEPGTPKAFARVAEWRRELIAARKIMSAPCPHERECPLFERGDWCHFAERLERTAHHRRIKGGSLGYEDEKFSYLAATSLPVPPRLGRIVRHPQMHSGYVQLQVCAPETLEQVTVTRSQKERYRGARKAAWGDRWPSS